MGASSTDKFEDFPGDPHLVATFSSTGNNGRSLIFNGHIDVAEVRPDEKWRYGAFTPVFEKGRFYGRGSTDMKGGIAAMLIAIRAVRQSGAKLGGDVIFESVTGEEAGEAGTKSLYRSRVPRGFRSGRRALKFQNTRAGRSDHLLAHCEKQGDVPRWNAPEDDSRRRRSIWSERD